MASASSCIADRAKQRPNRNRNRNRNLQCATKKTMGAHGWAGPSTTARKKDRRRPVPGDVLQPAAGGRMQERVQWKSGAHCWRWPLAPGPWPGGGGRDPSRNEKESPAGKATRAMAITSGFRGHGVGGRVCWVQCRAAFNPPRRRRRQTATTGRPPGPWPMDTSRSSSRALATSCPLCVLRERSERSHVVRRSGCYACSCRSRS